MVRAQNTVNDEMAGTPSDTIPFDGPQKKPVKDPFDSELTKVADKVIKTANIKRTTQDLFALAEQMGVDPFATLLNIADGNKLALSLDGDTDKPISPELRAMAARECLKYMYPTMKSAELTGPGGTSLGPVAVRVMFDGDDSDNKEE